MDTNGDDVIGGHETPEGGGRDTVIFCDSRKNLYKVEEYEEFLWLIGIVGKAEQMTRSSTDMHKKERKSGSMSVNVSVYLYYEAAERNSNRYTGKWVLVNQYISALSNYCDSSI